MKNNNRRILTVLFLGILMGALDISVVGPALPTIKSSLGVADKMSGWIFSIYILTSLIGVPVFSNLSDTFGRKSIYAVSLGIFALGSLLVALSASIELLLLGRAVQGLGASGIFPVGSAVIGDIFPKEKRGKALGMLGAVWGIAFIIGPLLAGIMLLFFSWQSLFIINIPASILLILFGLKILPGRTVKAKFQADVFGIPLLAIILVSFTFAFNNINPRNLAESIGSLQVLPLLILSVVLIPLFVVAEKRAANPIIHLNIFSKTQVKLVVGISFLTGFFQAGFVFMSDFLVNFFKVESSAASFMLLPIVGATAIGSPLFGRLLDKIGSRFIVVLGVVLTIGSLFALSWLPNSKMIYYAVGAAIGLGFSALVGPSLRYIMLNEAPASSRAASQGLVTMFMSIGQIIGSTAISGVIVYGVSIVHGYKTAFSYVGILMIGALVLSLLLKSKSAEAEGNSKSEG